MVSKLGHTTPCLKFREVSDALPFMEYEIHRQLVNKLKVQIGNLS